MSSASTTNKNGSGAGAGAGASNLNLGLQDITGENIKSFLRTLKHYQMLESNLLQLLKLSEFWELDNKYIYELCQPYMDAKSMEDAFLDWILLDQSPNRRQHIDKLCDFTQIRVKQILRDLLENRKAKVGELEEKVKERDQIIQSQKIFRSTETKLLNETIRNLQEKVEKQKFRNLNENISTIDHLTQELTATKMKLEESQQTCSAHEAKLKEITELNEQLKKRHGPKGAGDNEIPSKIAKTTPRSPVFPSPILTSHVNATVTQALAQLFGDDFNTSLSRNKVKIDLVNQHWSFHTLNKDGETEITLDNWKPDYAPYFRKLEISDILHGLNIYEVVSSLAPHITSLNFLNENLDYEWISDTTNGEKLSQFLDKFTNLESYGSKGLLLIQMIR